MFCIQAESTGSRYIRAGRIYFINNSSPFRFFFFHPSILPSRSTPSLRGKPFAQSLRLRRFTHKHHKSLPAATIHHALPSTHARARARDKTHLATPTPHSRRSLYSAVRRQHETVPGTRYFPGHAFGVEGFRNPIKPRRRDRNDENVKNTKQTISPPYIYYNIYLMSRTGPLAVDFFGVGGSLI